MKYYEWYQWIFFFFLYSFAGWIWESSYVSIAERRPVNRGFLRIPLIPLYGTGAVVALVLTIPFRGIYWLEYIVGAIGATCLELATGLLMERMFKMRYWDYSKKKFQIKGYICLEATLLWGFFVTILAEFIHPWVEENIAMKFPASLQIAIVLVVGVIFVYDTIYSFRSAFQVRYLLEGLSKLKTEIEEAQRQLEQLKEEISQYVSEQIAEGNAAVKKQKEERAKALKDTIESLRAKKEEMTGSFFAKYRYVVHSIPYTSSRWFHTALEELKTRYRNQLNGTKSE